MRQVLYTFITGLAMGASDIVPGVSGGTIAFISGVYQRLIDAIASFNTHALHLLMRGRLNALRRYVDGAFLLSLVLGIGLSILLLSSVMTRALAEHPSIVYSFFIGLIVASAALISKNVTRRSWAVIVMVIVGLVGGLLIAHLSPGTLVDPSRWMIMGAAAIAICAMILPGISGSFLLLIMGMYCVTLKAIHEGNFVYIGLFAAGASIGLLTFVRLVRRAFTRHHDVVVGLLLGLMIGSVPLLFPREAMKESIETRGATCDIVEFPQETTEESVEMITEIDWLVRALAFVVGVIAITGVDYARGHLDRYEDKKSSGNM